MTGMSLDLVKSTRHANRRQSMHTSSILPSCLKILIYASFSIHQLSPRRRLALVEGVRFRERWLYDYVSDWYTVVSPWSSWRWWSWWSWWSSLSSSSDHASSASSSDHASSSSSPPSPCIEIQLTWRTKFLHNCLALQWTGCGILITVHFPVNG